ncbi:MAG: PHP domain-containing protein, partial [Spirochaetales bacterium]|nr:PHP domain-containing protein [Spirochaetales bacterium]
MSDLDIVNNPLLDSQERLSALRDISAPSKGEINNHIHTVYSFSPYTPAMAAFKAREAGLEAAGSVDHDSIAAAEEMIAACAILGIGGCCGFELRVSFKKGPNGKAFAGRKINNPDSEGLVYMTVQGIPAPAIKKTEEFLNPIRAKRLERSKKMTAEANILLKDAGLPPIDFDADVIHKSCYLRGG